MNEDPHGNNPHQSMTLTYTGISRARLVVVTVEGASKREALARVRADDPTCPASYIRADNVLWIVDQAAAGCVPAPDERAGRRLRRGGPNLTSHRLHSSH